MTAARLGLAAGWMAAGSTGMLAGHPLRHGLTWTVVALAVIAAWPRQGLPATLARLAALAVVAAAAVPMIASPLPPLNVLAVSLVLLVLAQGLAPGQKEAICGRPRRRRFWASTAWPTRRLRWCGSGPTRWPARWGTLPERSPRNPCGLATATAGGVDYLVPMLFLAVALPLRSRRPAGAVAVQAAAVFLAGGPVRTCSILGTGELWGRSIGARIAGTGRASGGKQRHRRRPCEECCPGICRPSPRPSTSSSLGCSFSATRRRSRISPNTRQRAQGVPRGRPVLTRTGTVAAALLAGVLPLIAVLSWSKPDLAGKKIVFYEKGFLNWLKPGHGEYGRLTVGMYGMIPAYLESLGTRCLISPDLAAKDLQDADALVTIFPDRPWKPGQLDRIWDFVRQGGSLMVMGEHTVYDGSAGSEVSDLDEPTNRINDVLEPTAMRVRFDAAEFAIGGWLHSYDAMAHPTSAGIGDEANTFGVVIGASVDARWPARPILIGRLGFTDFGDVHGSAMLGNRHYDAGEKLGDVILAAEQTLGKGRVICFGDPSGLTNGLTVSCHDYTSRLYAYLAGGGDTPLVLWRQLAGLAIVLLLVGLLAWQPLTSRIAAVALPLAVSLAVCTAVTYRNWEVLPDGSHKSPNNLAYIDGGHLNNDTPESWREDGLGALHLTLMRNGLFPLVLNELTPERLLNEASPAGPRTTSRAARSRLRRRLGPGCWWSLRPPGSIRRPSAKWWRTS